MANPSRATRTSALGRTALTDARNHALRARGSANLGTTSIYQQGIATEKIIATVHARRAPNVRHRWTPALTIKVEKE